MALKSSSCAIVSCDVFQEELIGLAGDASEWGAVELLEMGLHDRPDVLRREVQAAVDQLEEKSGIDTILLLYGMCGNGLMGVRSRRCRLVLPRAHDCISILLGSPKRHQDFLKENPATYFYSPGWVRGRRVPGPDRDEHLRRFYGEKYSEDEELIDDLLEADRQTYAHHNCAAYVDVTNNNTAESYCQDCAASLGWEYRRLQGDPALLKDLLSGNWEAQRFLVTEPGQAITKLIEGSVPNIQG